MNPTRIEIRLSDFQFRVGIHYIPTNFSLKHLVFRSGNSYRYWPGWTFLNCENWCFNVIWPYAKMHHVFESTSVFYDYFADNTDKRIVLYLIYLIFFYRKRYLEIFIFKSEDRVKWSNIVIKMFRSKMFYLQGSFIKTIISKNVIIVFTFYRIYCLLCDDYLTITSY